MSKPEYDDVVFLGRIQKGIFVLGIELGFLLQGSTVPIQSMAINFVPDQGTQLFLSLIWSYFLATIGLFLFFICQRVVHNFLQSEELHDNDNDMNKNNENHQEDLFVLEDWKVNLQCLFGHGSVLGVFLSWLCTDVLMNHQTQVIYGGIMFLASLLYFMRQIWRNHGCLDHHSNNNTHHAEASSESQTSHSKYKNEDQPGMLVASFMV